MAIPFRASAPLSISNARLGPLAELPGTWIGNGFNLISLPDKHDNKPFRLKLNATREFLNFQKIGAPIPNRGSAQDDITFLGLHYLQEVNDADTREALHLEPGIWLNVPATTAPPGQPAVVRLANIPHGDSVLAQGQFLEDNGGPKIAVVSSTPFDTNTGQPLTDPAYLAPFSNPPLPPGIPAAAVANPNVILTNAIQGQNFVKTIVLIVSTKPAGGIVNIPFVSTNADAVSLNATFWIEFVKDQSGEIFLQLQYTQTVILNFLGISWPHISVATLTKR